MAIFKKEEKKTEENGASKAVETKDKKETTAILASTPTQALLSDIIISPRITEKTVKFMDQGIYTFNVRKDANKTEIKKAIKLIYNVEPIDIKIVCYPAKIKRNYRTGKLGKKKGGKKAIIKLKEGDKISII